ncbi:MAG: hypothetical protein K2Q01_09380, partial [Rickettsiales bacterium]|nr:hypothetical protein [Rickettsiales bacterium]
MPEMLEWLKANARYDPPGGPTYESLNKLIIDNPDIDRRMPPAIRRDFARLLTEKAEARWNLRFRGDTPFNAAMQPSGRPATVIIQEDDVNGWHAQFVRANAALAGGGRIGTALVRGDLSMSEDYFRILYTNADVVHTSGNVQVAFTRSQLDPRGHEHISNSRTFYTRTAGNRGRRARITDNPNDMPQLEQAGSLFLHGHGAIFGAATRQNGKVLLTEYSNVNIPTAIILEPPPETSLHVGDSLSENRDAEGFSTRPIRGTSFTAPQGAGWVGRVKAENPDLDNELIKYALIRGAEPVLARESQQEPLRYV